MSEIVKKTVFDLGTDCLVAIFKYLDIRDLIALRNAAAEFHEAVLTIFRGIGEIKLSNFRSIEATKAFLREFPFKIRNLNMRLRRNVKDAERAKYYSDILTQVDLDSVTHLSLDRLIDQRVFKDIMSRFRNLLSVTLYSSRLDEMNIVLDSIPAATLEEISMISNQLNARCLQWNRARGASKFPKMLKKHGSKLRVFKLEGNFFHYDVNFHQLIINIVSEFAPSLEVLQLNTIAGVCPDFAPLRQLKKLSHTRIIVYCQIDALRLAPIAQTLLLRLSGLNLIQNAYANLPENLPGLCLDVRDCEESRPFPYPEYLPKDLRTLCLHVNDEFCCNTLFASLHAHLPKLQRLSIFNGCSFERTMNGEAVLRYLQDAKDLIELTLNSSQFDDIECNEFYDRASEIIEKRENKLHLKIYHRGRTIVRNNSSLKLLRKRHDWCDFI